MASCSRFYAQQQKDLQDQLSRAGIPLGSSLWQCPDQPAEHAEPRLDRGLE